MVRVKHLKGQVPKELINICNAGFETLKLSYITHDLIVVDELFCALYFDLLDKNEVLDLLKKIKDEKDVILTGRKASKEFIDLADIVTEMNPVKHHYSEGKPAKEGIDF